MLASMVPMSVAVHTVARTHHLLGPRAPGWRGAPAAEEREDDSFGLGPPLLSCIVAASDSAR